MALVVMVPLEHRLNSCGAGAQLLHSMWHLPGSRVEPVSPALAGRFFITEPPGKAPTPNFLIRPSRSFFLKFSNLQCIFLIHYVIFLVVRSCHTLLQRHGAWPARLLCPWDFPGKNTGVGCHSFLQGISDPGLEPMSPALASRFFTTH